MLRADGVLWPIPINPRRPRRLWRRIGSGARGLIDVGRRTSGTHLGDPPRPRRAITPDRQLEPGRSTCSNGRRDGGGDETARGHRGRPTPPVATDETERRSAQATRGGREARWRRRLRGPGPPRFAAARPMPDGIIERVTPPSEPPREGSPAALARRRPPVARNRRQRPDVELDAQLAGTTGASDGGSTSCRPPAARIRSRHRPPAGRPLGLRSCTVPSKLAVAIPRCHQRARSSSGPGSSSSGATSSGSSASAQMRADARGRARRQPEDPAVDEAPAAAQEAPRTRSGRRIIRIWIARPSSSGYGGTVGSWSA